jgi:hypothetical protein
MYSLIPQTLHRRVVLGLSVCALALLASTARGQAIAGSPVNEVYTQIKAGALTGGSADVTGLILKRDRGEMTFNGTFYFTSAVAGHVTGAVFIGQGNFHASVPPSKFEQENVKRLLGVDSIDSDFKTAVLRFTDDTFEVIGKTRKEGGATNEKAQKLLNESDQRILRETGANVPARLALSLINGENPGFFFADIAGGARSHFSYVLDYQHRVPASNFGIDGGERGLIFTRENVLDGNEVWMAFYGLDDYKTNQAEYADVHNLIDATHYQVDVDLSDPGHVLKLITQVSATVLYPNLRAVSFNIGESLPEYDDLRKKKQMHLKSASVNGAPVAAEQEDWEGGFTVFLPQAVKQGEKLEFEFRLEGDFMRDDDYVQDCYYPASNDDWYPRHGFLDRATFDFTLHHKKKFHVAASGVRLSEEPAPESKDFLVTKYRMSQAVPLATFAMGPYERHADTAKLEGGGELPLEFNSLPGDYLAIKEDFILAEMNNAVRYFSNLFGRYPYPVFSAAYHPFGFGQGFATLLMIPKADIAYKTTYAFIAHETAHQWWGNVVAWRSYRDQWLSEGFAEYSGVLYTGIRDKMSSRDDLIRNMRRELKEPPESWIGYEKGRLVDVGPIILGNRLGTSKTIGAREALLYSKGALVLRMLHYLFTNPANGDDAGFFDMMKDFVAQYKDSAASTDDFRFVANDHFARSPIGQRFKINNLNWFFDQWVYQTALPSYQLEYQIQDQPDGSVVVSGNVNTEDAPDTWLMPLPVVFTFGEKQYATATVIAHGPKAPFSIKLPHRPSKVELDPTVWILSAKTSTKGH